MPFKSKSQVRACFAKKSRGQAKGWDCKEWADATPNIKKLPERKKSAEYNDIILGSFIKIAARLFDPRRSPVIKKEVIEARMTAPSVMNSVERRARNVKNKRAYTPQDVVRRS